MKRWQASKAYFWEAAPFFRLLLPLIFAIVCYDKNLLPALDYTTLFFALAGTLTLSAAFNLYKSLSEVIRFANSFLIHASIFLSGWFLCFLNDTRNDEHWFCNQLQTVEIFQVKILEKPAEKANTWKLKVELLKSYNSQQPQYVNGKAFVYVYKDKESFSLEQGDVIFVPNKWVTIKNAGNPYEFDYARFCHYNNIYHQQFIGRNEVVVYKKTTSEKSLVDATHAWAMNALNRYIKDTATLGLMQAMLLGDEVNFDPELRQTYVETGIIHIVAISGGHVIIFFQIISLLFFWLRNKRYEKLKYLIAVPLVCFYVAVAGAPTSAIRAAIMFSFIALGLMLQKDKQPLNQLFTTAFFMLLYEPMWLFSVGFQLSFSAVLSLILFYKPVYRLLPLTNPVAKKIWGAAAASIAAEIIIAPIVIFYFHLLPVTFLFANVIAYMFMGATLSAGLLLISISSFETISTLLADALTYFVRGFNYLIALFQKLNPDSFKHLYLSFEELIVVYVLIAAFAVFFLNKQRKALFIGLASTCLLLSLLIVRKWNNLHQQQFIVYNINKKTYAEIISGNHYASLINSHSINPYSDYATKELHIASGAWRQKNSEMSDVIKIKNQTVFLLQEPIAIDSALSRNVDYLMIGYPVKDFNAPALQRSFCFKKLVVASNQKRYIAEQWRDSCLKHNIPVHFTMFDGAFVLK
ncbi:MAG TPA: ComEC/Rec2 family competence protein [Flavipsychrobacter sp.]|nr:ComEC/Rec2 family competence protein [Flavipsychrobacter sp.]